MFPASHVDKVKLHSDLSLVLVRAISEGGQPFYMYIKADRKGVDAIHRWHESEGKQELSEFGEIVGHGWGHDPSDAVKKEMEKKYNFTH